MNTELIRGLSDRDIETEQVKVGEQLFRLRFQKSLGNQGGIRSMRSLKLDLARL